MDMSSAALPPNQPHISEADRKHPLFVLYMQHRTSCNRLMIQASSFADWLACHQAEQVRDSAAQHPRFREFQRWMRVTQAGRRKCPAGDFPANFEYWLTGARW
jgi:hypothetical protein